MSFNPKLATFSFFIFLSGLILSVLTIDAQKKLSSTCVNKNVNIGLNILLMLSVMMSCTPILQMFCYSLCKCNTGDLHYKIIVIVISILMAIGSAMIIIGLNKDKTTCSNQNTKTYAIGVLSFSIIMTVIMFFTYTRQWKTFFNKSDNTSKMPKVKMDFNN